MVKKYVAIRRKNTTILEWLRTFKKFKVTAMSKQNGVFVIETKFTNRQVKEKNKENKMLR